MTGSSRRRLLASFVSGASISEETIEEMWQLRASIFRLKPEVDPIADRRAFARRIRLAQRNLLLRDAGGRLRGMASFLWRPSRDERALWILPEYVFVHPDHRRDATLGWATVRVMLRVLAAARGRPVWLAGVAYPRAHHSLGRILAPAWTLADRGAPAQARDVLEFVHHTLVDDAHWDRETHRVWFPTRPEPSVPSRPSPEWQRCVELCPTWRDGFGVGVAMRVGLAQLLRSGTEIGSRVLFGRKGRR